MARSLRWLSGCVVVAVVSACITKGDTNITTPPLPEGGAGGQSAGNAGAAGSPSSGAGGGSGAAIGGSGASAKGGATSTSGGAGGSAGKQAAGTGGNAGTGAGTAGTSAQGGAGGASAGSGSGGSGGVAPGTCTFQPASQITSNSSSKRGLSVSTDGTTYFVAWLGQPGGTDKFQYLVSDGLGTAATPTTGAEAKPSGPKGAYVESVYSPTSQRFVALWMDHLGGDAYPRIQLVKPDGVADDATLATGLGSFISNDADGRHRLALSGTTFLVSYYFCAGGAGDCPNFASHPTFNNQPYMFLNDPTLVGSSPGLVYGIDPKFEAQRMDQTVPYADGESQTSGFLVLSLGTNGPRLAKITPPEKVKQPVDFEPIGMANINAETRIAWDGEALVAFSYGPGSGATQGQALRQERFTLLGTRTLEAKIDLPPVRPASIHVADATVSVLATDGAAIYFLQRMRTGEEILAPQIVGSGDTVAQAFLFRDASGFVAFWLAKKGGLEQVFSTRILCSP